MAECGVDWPLWDVRGPVSDPRSLGLSESLCDWIRRWFVAGGDVSIPDLPPVENMSEEELEAEALRLVDAIQEEVGENYRVIYVP